MDGWWRGGESVLSPVLSSSTNSVIQLQRNARLYFMLMVRRTTKYCNQLSGRDTVGAIRAQVPYSINLLSFFFCFPSDRSHHQLVTHTVGFEISTALRRVLSCYLSARPACAWVGLFSFLFLFFSFVKTGAHCARTRCTRTVQGAQGEPSAWLENPSTILSTPKSKGGRYPRLVLVSSFNSSRICPPRACSPALRKYDKCLIIGNLSPPLLPPHQ